MMFRQGGRGEVGARSVLALPGCSWGSLFLSVTLELNPEAGGVGWMQHFLSSELEGLEEAQFQGPGMRWVAPFLVILWVLGVRKQHHVWTPWPRKGTEMCVSQPGCSRRPAVFLSSPSHRTMSLFLHAFIRPSWLVASIAP